MAAIDSPIYRATARQDMTLPPMMPPPPPPRRATVGSPPPFSFSNTFESHRPSSRAERFGSDFPYPGRTRRSTVSGHAQGHNVNNASPLAAHDNVMLSDSASPSPIMSNATLFPGTSPTPSSSAGSPRPSYEYDNQAFSQSLHSPLQPSFSLCPSPDFPSHINHPRAMPPPSLPANFSASALSLMRPACSAGGSGATTTTPTVSPATSSTSFPLDPSLDHPNSCSPRAHDPALAAMSRDKLEAEVIQSRHRVRELEFFNDLHRLRVVELESADNKARVQNELGLFAQELPPSTTATTQPANDWRAPPDWNARTAARLKRFCGLNRAGNALCAWHDSRRERRAFPPRMAPPNTLNCGCTYAEALFEESLARNRVGAFYPGESVRMDPALRNPLLKLLQERYGYQDGDFERLANGAWREGEDAHSWEQRVSGSRSGSRRER